MKILIFDTVLNVCQSQIWMKETVTMGLGGGWWQLEGRKLNMWDTF